MTQPKLNQFPQLLEINFNKEYSPRSFPLILSFLIFIVQLRNIGATVNRQKLQRDTDSAGLWQQKWHMPRAPRFRTPRP